MYSRHRTRYDRSCCPTSSRRFAGTKLHAALCLALLGSSGATFAQDTTGATSSDAKTLDAVTVTGSRIRRVDTETANPVVTLDRAAIEATGKPTLGDLVQELPSIAGNATNPNTNNGGGTGASTVSLRGLGDKRTLILVNGVRLAYNDVNAIPASMIERVEVLSDGASAVYGSDAIGGVVNFILRDHYDGVQISSDFGTSRQSDGNRRNFSLTAGHTGSNYSIIAGLSYSDIDAVSAAARDYSKDALYLIDGASVKQGSSATPGGSINFNDGSAASDALAASSGCSRVTLNPGVTGATGRGDFHCYGGSDSYNYDPITCCRLRRNARMLSYWANTRSRPRCRHTSTVISARPGPRR
ncbi:Outer membrane cobalamin receptor protein [Luteibacter sp. 22Crub2.1]|nr:Outer membrane cobalamin receptor protein [Luteibacter sp. 22Crub2.1]